MVELLGRVVGGVAGGALSPLTVAIVVLVVAYGRDRAKFERALIVAIGIHAVLIVALWGLHPLGMPSAWPLALAAISAGIWLAAEIGRWIANAVARSLTSPPMADYIRASMRRRAKEDSTRSPAGLTSDDPPNSG